MGSPPWPASPATFLLSRLQVSDRIAARGSLLAWSYLPAHVIISDGGGGAVGGTGDAAPAATAAPPTVNAGPCAL